MKRLIILFAIMTGITAFSAAQVEETNTFRQEGIASWYGGEFNGRPTASGEIYNMAMFTAAHPTLPFGTVLAVTNTQNMRTVIVRVNDRGPFIPDRIIDLSMAAAEVLDMLDTGLAHVIIERVSSSSLDPAIVPLNVSVAATTPPATVSSVTAMPVAAVLPETSVEISVDTVVETPVDTDETRGEIVQTPQAVPITVQAYIQSANILGGIPSPDSTKLYRLQVGSFRIPRFAVDAFEKLANAGLDPKYEPYEDFYRVVLPGLKAGDIPSIAQTLGNIGFREAIIREEN